MADQGLILVCGAAGGTQGSTGASVVSQLAEQGLAVRALVHREDERAVALRARGIPTVVADLRDDSAVERAFEGVSSAYFAYPVRSGFLEAARVFAEAALRVATETVVSISHLNAGPDALSPRTREHGQVETLFNQMGVGAIHLRAAVFFENIKRQAAVGIAAVDELQMPLGNPTTKIPLIAGEDVARLAAGLLVNPDPYRGKPVFAIGEVLSAGDLASIFTNVLGRVVTYRSITDADWRASAGAREGDDASVQVEHLSAVWSTMRFAADHAPDRFKPTPELFEALAGQPAESFADFVDKHAGEFNLDD